MRRPDLRQPSSILSASLALARASSTVCHRQHATANNVLDAGGASTNTSIWLMGWGEDTAHGLFPKGSRPGLQQRDMGEVPLTDPSTTYQGYRTHFKWEIGLRSDWRFVVRIANINVTAGAVTTSNLINTLITAVNKLAVHPRGRQFQPPGAPGGTSKPGQVNSVVLL